MLKLKHELDTPQALAAAINAVAKRLEDAPAELTPTDVRDGTSVMRASAFNYGVVDCREEQHLGLLYYWLLRIRKVNQAPRDDALRLRFERDEAQEQRRKDFDDWNFQHPWYDLALIGRGSSIAYYVNSLGDAHDHRHTALIGTADPWHSTDPRSRGDGFINHEQHLIGQWSDTVPAFGTEYLAREDFAEQNRRVLERIPHQFDYRVKHVSAGSWGFRIESDGPTLWAKRVILGSGAGPHFEAGSRGIDVAPAAQQCVVDLDEFMRKFPSTKARQVGRVIVHGPNAGIDAVERARELGFEVTWLMSEGSAPRLLPGNRLKHARYVVPSHAITRDAFKLLPAKPLGNTIFKVELDGASGKLSVRYVKPDGAASAPILADYYVVALGQDAMRPEAVASILGDAMVKALKPLYDIQGRHDDKGTTVLGKYYSSEDMHLLVIGAAAGALGVSEDDLAPLIEQTPQSVVTRDQLGTVKSSVGSITSVMPSYVTREVNFTTDDRTVLRTHLAVRYPNIDEARAQEIIAAILGHRRTGYHPLGYDAWWQLHWQQVLEIWNAPHDSWPAIRKKHEQQQEELETRLRGQQPGLQV